MYAVCGPHLQACRHLQKKMWTKPLQFARKRLFWVMVVMVVDGGRRWVVVVEGGGGERKSRYVVISFSRYFILISSSLQIRVFPFPLLKVK
ncbi:hypothetical protein QVD17_31090 [Tagetes erecta]|uniref:Uncharacterized protein n=1 Tax=Tagetes erecta TaxID=13708 RepID=A0AAD8K5I9_TARER|nr:hypothetical protein QVD17_31090 [Tagetes erecta]